MKIAKKSDLRSEFVEVINVLWERVEKFPWHDSFAYAACLAQTYYLVHHTTRLLSIAASQFGASQDEWHKTCLQNLREETGHDLLALEDVQRLGYRIEDFPELPHTIAVYSHQYYRVHHCGPISMWGYSLMVEGLASLWGNELHQKVEDPHGSKVSNFTRVHARVDPGHFDAGLELLKDITEAERASVITNLRHSQVLWRSMLDGIEQFCAANQKLRRAA